MLLEGEPTPLGQGLGDLVEALTLQVGYNSTLVTLAVAALGFGAGFVGAFAMLRQRSLMVDVVAHTTLPGIALAAYVGFLLGLDPRGVPLLSVGALLSGLAAMGLVHQIVKRTRLDPDSAQAVVLSSGFGLGIVLLSGIQDVEGLESAGLEGLLLGQAATLRAIDAYWLAGIAALVLVGVTLLRKEFSLVSFDAQAAGVAGWPVARLDFALQLLIAAVSLAGIFAVGAILVMALIALPAAAARLWTHSVRWLPPLSGAIGAFSAYVGAALTAAYDGLPTGPMIVIVAGAALLVSFVFGRAWGLAGQAARPAPLGLGRSLLRATDSLDHGLPTGSLRRTERRIVQQLERAGLVTQKGSAWYPTESGERALEEHTALAAALGKQP